MWAPAIRAPIVIAVAVACLALASAAPAAVDLKVKLPAPGNITVARFVVESSGTPKLVLANRARLASTVAVVGAVRPQEGVSGSYEVAVVILRGCASFAGSTEPAALTMSLSEATVRQPPGLRVWQNVATRPAVRYEVPAIPASWISRVRLTRFRATQVMRHASLLGLGKRADAGVLNLLRAMSCPPPARPPAAPTPGIAPKFQLTGITLSYRINSKSDADICVSWGTTPAQRNAAATVTVVGPGTKVTVKPKTDAQGKAAVKVNVKANFGLPLPVPFTVGLQMQDASGPLVYSNVVEVGPLATRPGTCTL